MNILLVLVKFDNIFKGFAATSQIQQSLTLHICKRVDNVVSKLAVRSKPDLSNLQISRQLSSFMDILLVLVEFDNIFKSFVTTLQIQQSLTLHIRKRVWNVVSKLDVRSKRDLADKSHLALTALKLKFQL